ncbi:ribbon-helix-helix protein, CopG family [Acidocella sp.]|uniref:ribbon-helix-helix protein, CopG family n=1 Tax=Acidocella sp. TaxID=50710 RepID=UPI0017EF66CE|nr:ribbon-helix-helix protein, CopG family [Acidocella sp.]NNM55855.1 ribbon-helix-helix protein, CopG family [Acidocella sp.]
MTGTCIYLPSETLAALDNLARRTGRTRSGAVRRIIEKTLIEAGLYAPPPHPVVVNRDPARDIKEPK